MEFHIFKQGGGLFRNSSESMANVCYFLSQLCVGAEELYDKTMIISLLVPLAVILLITILTDLFTFSYKRYSTQPAENYFLRDICKICLTHCNDNVKITAVQKVDIPLKCTAISCILLAPMCLFHNFVLQNISEMYMLFLLPWLFFTALNLPMIVCLSTKNNFTNIATARQRNNTLGWIRTHKQQWEINCAHKDRIQISL